MNQIIHSKASAPASPPPVSGASVHKAPLGLRTVAIFELAKGLLVLVAGLGLLSLVHRDAQHIAEEIVIMLRLNPAHEFPGIFITTASHLTNARLWYLSVAALVYATVRFVETYGLWHERPWAEWFAVISASLYLPVEAWHLILKPGMISLLVPVVNIGIVLYLALLLAHNSRHSAHPDPEI